MWIFLIRPADTDGYRTSHRPSDNDRYVRYAPDNPKKVIVFSSWLLTRYSLFTFQTQFHYDGMFPRCDI
jgi:hypothetical protein